MWPFKNKKPETEELPKKQELKHLALNKIKSIEIKNKKRFDPKLLDEVAKVYRIYMKERYSLKPGLTFEEISVSLSEKKIKPCIKIKERYLLTELNELEYGNQQLTKEKLAKVIDKLKKIIKSQ